MDGLTEPKPSVYVETTIVSYLTARPSRDVIILGHQELTRIWWEWEKQRYRVLISPAVAEEARQGDPSFAEKRLALLAGLESLEPDPAVEAIAAELRQALSLPERAASDAIHLAFAVHYEVDYLLTWNCKHLANARNLRLLAEYTSQGGSWLPIVCTPAEMVDITAED